MQLFDVWSINLGIESKFFNAVVLHESRMVNRNDIQHTEKLGFRTWKFSENQDLRTRISGPRKVHSLPQAELTRHLLKVLHCPLPQLLTVRSNSRNLWLVRITNQAWTWCCTWALWRRRQSKRQAWRPCCHRCTTPAAYIFVDGPVDGEGQHHGAMTVRAIPRITWM